MCDFPPCSRCARPWAGHYPDPADCPDYTQPPRLHPSDVLWALWWLTWELIRR